jgi:hypothetical protein
LAEKTLIFKSDLLIGVISLVLIPDIWSLLLKPVDIHNDIFSADKNSIQAEIVDKTVGFG